MKRRVISSANGLSCISTLWIPKPLICHAHAPVAPKGVYHVPLMDRGHEAGQENLPISRRDCLQTLGNVDAGRIAIHVALSPIVSYRKALIHRRFMAGFQIRAQTSKSLLFETVHEEPNIVIS